MPLEARQLVTSFEALRTLPLTPVEIALPDSGIDASHPDLSGRVVTAWDVIGPGDRFRVVPRLPGADADLFGHGTAVASVIARVAPNARFVDLRVLGPHDQGPGSALAAGVAEGIAQGARIIHLSLAAGARERTRLWTLCEKAYRRGQVVVAARRNLPLLDDGYPAELSSVVGVDAAPLDSLFELRYRAGSAVEFAAAGEHLRVAVPGGGHTERSGTSFAAPVVTGLVALMLGAWPDLRPFEVKALLRAHAKET